MPSRTAEWNGGLIASIYHDGYVKIRAQLADYAYKGDWDAYFSNVGENADEASTLVNSWRLRDAEDKATRQPSRWMALHQAAVLPDTSLEVFEKLIDLGAWRLLRTLDGKKQTAYEIAVEQNRSQDTLDVLKPVIKHEIPKETIAAFQKAMEEIVVSRVEDLLGDGKIAMFQIDILRELEKPLVWFPIPGFYGVSAPDPLITPPLEKRKAVYDKVKQGFRIELNEDGNLQLESWCRVVGGSGQRHIVEKTGEWKMVEEGFV